MIASMLAILIRSDAEFRCMVNAILSYTVMWYSKIAVVCG